MVLPEYPPWLAVSTSPLMSLTPPAKVADHSWLGPLAKVPDWPPTGYGLTEVAESVVAGEVPELEVVDKPKAGVLGSNGSSEMVQFLGELPP